MGSPLCFTDTFNVVGINYASETKVDKYAYLIEPAVKIIKVDVMERRLIGRYDEEQKKYFWNYQNLIKIALGQNQIILGKYSERFRDVTG